MIPHLPWGPFGSALWETLTKRPKHIEKLSSKSKNSLLNTALLMT